MRISEARVQRGRPLDPVERAIDGRNRKSSGFLRPSLQVGLVDLNHVCARCEQGANLFVDGDCERHRQLGLVLVVVVLRLLRHREWTRQGGLDGPVGVGA